MKKDLNHIENLFKNKFDGFEANVDPSVWNNIQSNIGGTTGIAASATKAILTKVIAGVVIATGLATSTYFLLVKENNKNSNQIIVENTITPTQQLAKGDIRTEENDAQKIEVKKVDQLKVNSAPVISVKKKSNQEKTLKNNINNTQSINENKTVEEVASTQKNSAQVEKQNNQESPKNMEETVVEQVKLNIKIKASTLNGKAPLDVEFDVDGDAVAFSWNFGDGSEISDQETSFHTFSKPGKYMVKLTAIDKNANSKTVVQLVTVESNIKSSLNPIPSVFSPNKDGINDIIKIDGEHIKKFNANVSDSKGNLVFEWNSLEGFWDGRDLNNQELPKGTYYIVVIAVGEDGEELNVRQSIQLF